MIPITPGIAIDESEITENFVRASGPGGQHVNKTSSAVQLRFDARRSPSLPDEVAIRLMKLAGNRVTRDGVIVIIAQRYRSQQRNRDDALERLVGLIRRAALPPRIRKATKTPRASRERRLSDKKSRALVKTARRRPDI